MSERIELTRGAPDTESALEYSGPDLYAAIHVLTDGKHWFGPVKLWTDSVDLAEQFEVAMNREHPGGSSAISFVVYERYTTWRSRKTDEPS